MAESKGALIAKSVQKHAGRAKEKVFMEFTYYKIFRCSDICVQNLGTSAVKVDFMKCAGLISIYAMSVCGHDLITPVAVNL